MNGEILKVRHPTTGEVWTIETGFNSIREISYEGPTTEMSEPERSAGKQARFLVAMMSSQMKREDERERMQKAMGASAKREANIIFYKGKDLEQQDKLEEALEAYIQAIDIYEEFGKAWFHRFKVHFKLGQMIEALDCATRVVTIAPRWLDLILKLDRDGKLASSIEEIESLEIEERREIVRNALLEIIVRTEPPWLYRGRNKYPHTFPRGGYRVMQKTDHYTDKGPQVVKHPTTGEKWEFEISRGDLIVHQYYKPNSVKDNALGTNSDARLHQAILASIPPKGD